MPGILEIETVVWPPMEVQRLRILGKDKEHIMAKKNGDSVANIWALYQAEQVKIQSLKEQMQKAEADADLLKQKLVSMIPAGEVVDNVIHKRFEKKNVSYAKVVSYMREKMIPKTKQAEVDVVIAENTSVSVMDKIELVK